MQIVRTHVLQLHIQRIQLIVMPVKHFASLVQTMRPAPLVTLQVVTDSGIQIVRIHAQFQHFLRTLLIVNHVKLTA